MDGIDIIAIPLVIVYWNDAWGSDGECDTTKLDHKPYFTKSVGWLLKSDHIGVTLAMDLFPEEPTIFKNSAFLPRGMVTEIVFLEERKDILRSKLSPLT